jgi:putative transposase
MCWSKRFGAAGQQTALPISPTGGVQYLSIRYTERVAEAGTVTSVGSRGDSSDNALAESVNALYKAELVRRRGPWKGLGDLQFATLEWVDWFNNTWLFSVISYMPPAEYKEVQRTSNYEGCYSSPVLPLAGTQLTGPP